MVLVDNGKEFKMYLSNANKTKTYYLYFVNPLTNKITSRSCNTKLKREATNFLKNFEVQVSNCVKIDRSSLRLSDVKGRIFSHYKMNNAPQTYKSVKSSYENLIRHIGDKNISLIGKSDIEDFKLKRSKEISLISTNIDVRNIKQCSIN